MEPEFSSPEAARRERTLNLAWLIGVLGVGIVAAAIATPIYAAVGADLQRVVLMIAGMLIGMCIFVATMLSIAMYRSRIRPKQE